MRGVPPPHHWLVRSSLAPRECFGDPEDPRIFSEAVCIVCTVESSDSSCLTLWGGMGLGHSEKQEEPTTDFTAHADSTRTLTQLRAQESGVKGGDEKPSSETWT